MIKKQENPQTTKAYREVTVKPAEAMSTMEYQAYLIQQSNNWTRIAKKKSRGRFSSSRITRTRSFSCWILKKTEEFNPFSEKSKKLITDMGNAEIFELCETSSKKHCPDCALYWEVDIIYCTCGKCMQPTERNRQLNKARYDVLSIPGYVVKKNPTDGASHGPSMRQYICYKAHDTPRKASKHKSGGYNTIVERLNNDDKYRKSLPDIGWTEEQIIQ